MSVSVRNALYGSFPQRCFVVPLSMTLGAFKTSLHPVVYGLHRSLNLLMQITSMEQTNMGGRIGENRCHGVKAR